MFCNWQTKNLNFTYISMDILKKTIEFEAVWHVFGKLNAGMDSICIKRFRFYSDLSVDMSVFYSASGNSEVRTIKLSVENYQKLAALISKEKILPYCVNACGLCDSEVWDFVLHSAKEDLVECKKINVDGVTELKHLVGYLNESDNQFSFSTYGVKSITNLFY